MWLNLRNLQEIDYIQAPAIQQLATKAKTTSGIARIRLLSRNID